jgi:[lysine-biosynthesis-protein LysW]---L-2-aminoadipate ligase
MRCAIVAGRPNATTVRLAGQLGRWWRCLTPREALDRLGLGDIALGRLDVLPTLDGIEGGLGVLNELEARGATVLNRAGPLLAAHDKLVTARLLRVARLPHPFTRFVTSGSRLPLVRGPVVVKPRFGSWGAAVERCDDTDALASVLAGVADASWFKRHGALVQELVEPRGYDLRIVVAGGQVVGAASRVSAPGEWRTNIALGATRVPVDPPLEARRLALDAAAVAGLDLVGVDLLPVGDGWTVLELNGAVDFTSDYSLGEDIFAAAALALRRVARRSAPDAPLVGVP